MSGKLDSLLSGRQISIRGCRPAVIGSLLFQARQGSWSWSWRRTRRVEKEKEKEKEAIPVLSECVLSKQNKTKQLSFLQPYHILPVPRFSLQFLSLFLCLLPSSPFPPSLSPTHSFFPVSLPPPFSPLSSSPTISTDDLFSFCFFFIFFSYEFPFDLAVHCPSSSHPPANSSRRVGCVVAQPVDQSTRAGR